jgi:CHAD domain-containing protein
MAHKIGSHEGIGAALIRLVRDDLEAVRAGLAGNGPADRRIHRARQRLKRLRSLLRVLKPALGANAFIAKRKLREAAKLLASAREADAAVASARGLRAEAAGRAEAALDRLVMTLDREAKARHAGAPPTAAVIALIRQAEARLADVPDEFAGSDLLEEALERAYRRGGKALRRAETSLSMPDLHRWRKDVKDLWHLMRLARERLPGGAGKLAKRLEKLGELLGLDHDHAILAAKLADAPPSEPALMRQLQLIAEKRRALEGEAFILGERLYRRSPKRIGHRLRIG